MSRPPMDGVDSRDPLVRFFAGSGTDQNGRRLQDILALDHHAMEADHRFVGWLFPTPEKSAFSYSTPPLSPEGAREMRGSPVLKARLREAFEHMLDFYGLALVPGAPPRVVESSTFSHRARVWLTPGNHNYLRISRVLRSLECLGLGAEAHAFLAYLETLYLRRGEVIGERTLGYWRLRASGRGEPLPGD